MPPLESDVALFSICTQPSSVLPSKSETPPDDSARPTPAAVSPASLIHDLRLRYIRAEFYHSAAGALAPGAIKCESESSYQISQGEISL